MSRCDIQISFYRTDRIYRGGESVSGEVLIRVNQETQCDAIFLTNYWRTHGRGNASKEDVEKIRLAGSELLRAGEEMRFPFEFQTTRWPLTYHGDDIYLDHYVHVAVHVPWAKNPKQEEDYLLLPGECPEQITEDRHTPFDLSKPTANTGRSGIIGRLLVGLLIVVVVAVAAVLSPLLLIGGIIWWIRRRFITGRVGKVALKMPHLVVAPGEDWPLEISFKPGKTFPINGITVKILAQEAATTGSGTNRTTHQNTLLEEIHTLYPEGQLTAGETVSQQTVLSFPQTEAWSLSFADNKIEWSAEVRIDIPRFPDWAEKKDLQVLPAEFLSKRSSGPARLRQEPSTFSHAADDGSSRWNSRASEDLPENPPVDSGSVDSAISLATLAATITQVERHGNERSEITAAASERDWEAEIIVDRVSMTFGHSGGDPRYENGRTITGRIVGTDQDVQLFLPEAGSRVPRDISQDETCRTAVRVLSWDSLYNRLVLHEIPDYQ